MFPQTASLSYYLMSFKTSSLLLSHLGSELLYLHNRWSNRWSEDCSFSETCPSPHSMKEVELETSSFPWIITASLPFLSVKTPAVLLKLLRGVVLTSCSLTCILWRLWYLLIALWSATHRTITLVHFSNYHTQLAGFIFLWPVICSEFCLRFFSSDMATQKTFPLKHWF